MLNNYFDTDFTDSYTLPTPQLLLLGGISLDCLRNVQDYYVIFPYSLSH